MSALTHELMYDGPINSSEGRIIDASTTVTKTDIIDKRNFDRANNRSKKSKDREYKMTDSHLTGEDNTIAQQNLLNTVYANKWDTK